MTYLPLNIASRMAIFTRFSMSAPVNPGVICDNIFVSISTHVKGEGTEIVCDLADVVIEDLLATARMRHRNVDHVVEASRSNGCGVESVTVVCSPDDQNRVVLVEPVHRR
jgi:hypothetical protein